VAIAADAHPEQDPIVGQVLECGDLLGDPGRFAQRHDQDAQGQPDALRCRGRASEHEHAVEDRVARAGNQLIDGPRRLEAERFDVHGGGDGIGDWAAAVAEGRQEDADRGNRHEVLLAGQSFQALATRRRARRFRSASLHPRSPC
jgi:hypothetical protein